MPYDPPSIATLENRIKSDIRVFFPDANLEEENSFLSVIARMNALNVARVHNRIRRNVNELHPATASVPTLYVMAKSRGLRIRTATFSRGNVDVTGPADTFLPINTEFRTQRGLRFKTTVVNTLDSNGRSTVNLRSVNRGSEYNIAAGVSLTSTISGVGGVVDSDGFTGGVDAESASELRLRLVQLYNSGTPIGRDEDWELWVKRYPGVSRVWISRNEFNVGTVTVRFAIDDTDHEYGVPTDAEIQEVDDLLNAFVGGYVRYKVVKQILVPLDIRVAGISPDTELNRKNIEQAIRTRIHTSAEPGGSVPNSWVLDAVGSYASVHGGASINGTASPDSSVILNIGEYPYINTLEFVTSLA